MVFSDEVCENGDYDGGRGRSNRQSTLNFDRSREGAPPLVVVSLEAVAKRAYTADYFYAENVLAEIPAYSSVSRFCSCSARCSFC